MGLRGPIQELAFPHSCPTSSRSRPSCTCRISIEAVRFFTDVLGFTAHIHGPNYAYVQRETAGVRILKASTSPGEIPGPGTRAFRYYIDVRDVDTLYAELKPKVDAWPGGRIHGPVNQALRPTRDHDPRARWRPGRLWSGDLTHQPLNPPACSRRSVFATWATQNASPVPAPGSGRLAPLSDLPELPDRGSERRVLRAG